MEDKKITVVYDARLGKYRKITETALKQVKKNIVKGKEKQAEEIINMVENYVSDAGHFKKKGHYVNAFAALNYAHGWLDCGVRLGVFDVNDDRLFTVN